MIDKSWHVMMAERASELAYESDTKKEADGYWRDYRHHMNAVDPDLFKQRKPRVSFGNQLATCLCGSNKMHLYGKRKGDKYLSCDGCNREVGPAKTKETLKNRWNKMMEIKDEIRKK